MAEETVKRQKRGRQKHMPALALWALYVRSSFYKILPVLAGMVLTEGLLFWKLSGNMAGKAVPVTPERMIEGCFLKQVFLLALGRVFFILLWTEGQRGGAKSSYTLMRLKVSLRRQFALRTAYNVLCLALVFTVQAAFAAALCVRYGELLPEKFVSPQLLFLAFYRSTFLHNLLPMAEAAIWIRNLLLLLAFGMEAALESRGRRYPIPISLYGLSVVWFAPPAGRLYTIFGILVYGCFIAADLLRVIGVIGENEFLQEEKAAGRLR